MSDSGFSSLWTDCPEGLTAMGNWQGIWQPGCVFVDVFEFFCVSFLTVLRFLLPQQHLFHFLSFSHFGCFHFDFVSFFCFLCFLFLSGIMCSEVPCQGGAAGEGWPRHAVVVQGWPASCNVLRKNWNSHSANSANNANNANFEHAGSSAAVLSFADVAQSTCANMWQHASRMVAQNSQVFATDQTL